MSPRQDLIAYLEFDGLDAHADAWKKSAAYKLLNDTKLGALLEDLASQGFELMRQSAGGDSPVTPADMIDLVKHVARHGGAVGVWGKPDDPDGGGPGIVFVARRGDRPSIRHMLEDAAPGTSPDAAGQGPIARRSRRPAVPITRSIRRVAGGSRRGIWSYPTGRTSSCPSSTARSPTPSIIRSASHFSKAKEGFQPVAAGFVDITAVPPMPPQAVQLGLDGLKRIELQWGIQDDALVAVLGAVAPAPRRGILAFLDQPTFNIRSLPPLPAGLTGFAVLSLDFARIYDQVVELAKQSNPQGADGFAQIEAAFQPAVWNRRFARTCSRASDRRCPSIPSRRMRMRRPIRRLAALAPFTGLTISAQIRGDSLAKVIDPLIQTINQIIQAQQAGARRGPAGPQRRSHRVPKAGRPCAPLMCSTCLRAGFLHRSSPCFSRRSVLGKDQLVVAATTPNAVRAVDLAGAAPDQLWRPTGAFIPMARRLPGDLVFLNVSDPRDTLPQLVQSLPVRRPAGQHVATGRAIGTRGGSPRPVHQQPEADRLGDAQLPWRIQ